VIDPRGQLRAAYAQWLRVRANVRALAASLVAAEYALRRDMRRSDDPDYATLVRQLAAERSAIDVLAAELDGRIAHVKSECAAIEACYVETVGATVRRSPDADDSRFARR
jgi:hypothetical protein